MPFFIGSAKAGFTKVSGTGEDIGVAAWYKYMGYRENNRDVMQRHEAFVDMTHVEVIEKYGKVYWNTIDNRLTSAEKEAARDALLRADRCLRDYGYGLK
ncbi:hypothetical protein CN931_11035 [Bacillus sp. AFS054943]|uniref:hypothetical protein n=1 Tax=Bacillus sp. AFS054943 TaxID=2033506 RepID=UPI000BFB1289|nr:hypothetical protein [Bacillus sp. AFS054943]PGL84629.1 hypothetical protein CN931_11035 [Bacillus sp. AFS054943]